MAGLLYRRVQPARPDSYYARRLQLRRLAARHAGAIAVLIDLRDALLGRPVPEISPIPVTGRRRRNVSWKGDLN